MYFLLFAGGAVALVYAAVYLYAQIAYYNERKETTPYFYPGEMLMGDLHCHSAYSEDGVFPVGKIIQYAKGAGLDFVAVTDHNDIRAVTPVQSLDGMLMVPGPNAP